MSALQPGPKVGKKQKHPPCPVQGCVLASEGDGASLQAADLDEGPVWPLGLRHRLPDAPTHSILAQQGPVHAVGLAQTSEGRLAYCLGHTGALKIFNATTGSQVRG